jgi:predicted 3-demethylubiquinone-9 3-methyltransferase (glyoxalase superfamily)
MEKRLDTNKLTTNLWYETQAEEAVKLYTSIFRNAKTGRINRYGKEGYEIHGMPEGTVMTVEFELEGQQFLALNGGPHFKFNEAISFIVNCDSQDEIDYYWEKLSEGGDPKAQVCGWLKDKFGMSWQVVPRVLNDMIQDKDKRKAGNVMTAMLKMKKMDIAELEAAYGK